MRRRETRGVGGGVTSGWEGKTACLNLSVSSVLVRGALLRTTVGTGRANIIMMQAISVHLYGKAALSRTRGQKCYGTRG